MHKKKEWNKTSEKKIIKKKNWKANAEKTNKQNDGKTHNGWNRWMVTAAACGKRWCVVARGVGEGEGASEALFIPQMKRMSRVATAWQVETRRVESVASTKARVKCFIFKSSPNNIRPFPPHIPLAFCGAFSTKRLGKLSAIIIIFHWGSNNSRTPNVSRNWLFNLQLQLDCVLIALRAR